MISGSVGEKYLIFCFVNVEMNPFSFNFSRMSYVVTRFMRAFSAMRETTLGPISMSEI